MEQEVIEVMKEYERQTATKDFSNVAPMLDPQALYVFTDGRFFGLKEIETAFNKTWDHIRNEKYSLDNYQAVIFNENLATVAYDFRWEGDVDGVHSEGIGRGANTLFKNNGTWKIVHEYLSK